ncbi:MAG: hypothetical protein HYV28_18235 [Ignavibacteriales bacterium]|nr:hypothetical protein [Ignavibacteriales bacterium]
MSRIIFVCTFFLCAYMIQAQSYKYRVEAIEFHVGSKKEKSFPKGLVLYQDAQTNNLRLSNGTTFKVKNYKPKSLGNGLVGWEASTKDDDGTNLSISCLELNYSNSGKWAMVFSNKRYEIIYILSEFR